MGLDLDIGANITLREMQHDGVLNVALDDFGSGYLPASLFAHKLAF